MKVYSSLKFGVFAVIFLIVTGLNHSRASHILGGELGWICQGNGSYVFELVIYRDCNGLDVSPTSEMIQVWKHPTIDEIPVNFISRVDMSPFCQSVPSGPMPFLCGTGGGAGNGTGAVERVLYRSNPIALPGNPPNNGWIFTYSSFFRSATLTNLASPSSVGITIMAKMFNTGANGICNDSSPRFYEPPYVVTCAGSPYTFNPNAYDPDLDVMSFHFARPLDQIQVNYNPPTDPAVLTYNSGFSHTNPTPIGSIAPGSVASDLDNDNGTLTFNSSVPGNFVIKTIVRAYRNGAIISENQLEYQVAVENCLVQNSPPAITPPFNNNTSFETTVTAGDLVSFNLSVFENELLQDGNAQSAYIYASGAQFANVITDPNSGCAEPPCATLNSTIPISGSPNAQVNFSWQTTCEHLEGENGQIQSSVPYTFVFRVQDDFCQIPAVKYATVTVNVQNLVMPTTPELLCVDLQSNGDVILNWTPSIDAGGNFIEYEVRNLENGLLTVINNINTSTYTHVGTNALNQTLSYYVVVRGGCNGIHTASSDTLTTIHLNLNNPNNGLADLSWTGIPDAPGIGNYAYLEIEYPAGTWTVVDSFAITATNMDYEITICEAFLNFRIFVENDNCTFLSNTVGDFFEDQTPPVIPTIQSVSIDTLTGNLIITWDVNPSKDTYGYIIYNQDNNGFYVEMDTIWGINNNSYTISNFNSNLVQSFTVAAFDSCFTDQSPPTYQTSGKAEIHATMLLESIQDPCNLSVSLSWSPYLGWPGGVGLYRVYLKVDGADWVMVESTNTTNTNLDLQIGVLYHIVIQAVSEFGFYSFSNIITANLVIPGEPEIHYLSTASVDWNGVLVKYYSSFQPGEGTVLLQKLNPVNNEFEDIEQRTVLNSVEQFLDLDHQAHTRREVYRIVAIDSCGNPTIYSNIGKTILLSTEVDNAALTVKLSWQPYEHFSAPIVNYRIYRSVNGLLDPNPLATLPYFARTFVDTVSEFYHTTGEFCYFVQAVEGYNEYGFFELSRSNYSCAVVEHLVYVPNTIIINGINELFLPIVGFTDMNNYDLTILDRWGQTVFKTNNPTEGWNGSMGGKTVPEGTYIYILRLNNGDKTEITRRGHLNVLIGG